MGTGDKRTLLRWRRSLRNDREISKGKEGKKKKKMKEKKVKLVEQGELVALGREEMEKEKKTMTWNNVYPFHVEPTVGSITVVQITS